MKSKYKNQLEWKKENIYAYRAALKNGWLSEIYEQFGWTKEEWTKERCLEDAQKFQTRKQWNKSSSSAARIAKKNGWYEECCTHMIEILKPKFYWTKERCLEDALKYSSVKDWRGTKKSAYSIAVANQWLKECTNHMAFGKTPDGTWTKEKCIEDAKRFKTIKEWKKESGGGAYLKAIRNNWIDECCSHMETFLKQKKAIKTPMNTYTKEICMQDAKKYSRVTEWANKSSPMFGAALRKGWFNECTAHMIKLDRKPRGYWTKEKCIEDAKLFKNKNNWKKMSAKAFSAAWRNKWINECF